MDKQKIIKNLFIIFSVVLFVFSFVKLAKKAVFDVSNIASSSVQVFATNRAQTIFNLDVFREYRACKIKAKKNAMVHDYVRYCIGILNNAAVPKEGYLQNISSKFYHYHWLSETFSNKYGRIVYKMDKKDIYLSKWQCLFMLAGKFCYAFLTSLILSILCYLGLIFLQKFALKSVKTRILLGGIIMMALFWGFAYKLNVSSGGGAGGNILLSGGDAYVGDLPVLLKFIITILSTLIVYKEFKICKYSFWTIGFALMVFVYNPIIPIVKFLTYIKLSHIVNKLFQAFFAIYLIKEYRNSNS